MFRHLLIDEMQDTNAVQVALVESIATAGPGNLTAVGDDAQSIYRFRGANYDNILKFPERNPGANVFRLEINYRSTPEIVAFTNASIARNRHRLPQDARLGAAGGNPARWSSRRPTPTRRPNSSASRSWTGTSRGSASRGSPSCTATTTTASCSRRSWSRGGSTTRCAAGCGSSSRRTSRTCWPILRLLANPRDEPAWRRLLLLLPGVGPAKASALWAYLASSRRPARGRGDGRGDGDRPGQGEGVLRRLRGRPAQGPGDRPRDRPRRRHRRDPPGRLPGDRPRPATSGPTTASPTSSSWRSWPRATTASNA